MKKVFLLLIIALAVLTVFVACEKNPEFELKDGQGGNASWDKFEYKEGMTWADFAGSSYDSLGLKVDNGVIKWPSAIGTYYIYDTNNSDKVASDSYIESVTYYAK